MDQEIAIGRAGHYFTPNSSDGEELAGACQQATVAWYGGPEEERTWVNVGGLDHNGSPFQRTSVPVAAPATGGASFHLNRACPWAR